MKNLVLIPVHIGSQDDPNKSSLKSPILPKRLIKLNKTIKTSDITGIAKVYLGFSLDKKITSLQTLHQNYLKPNNFLDSFRITCLKQNFLK